MTDRPVTIFISAAEASGDERGAELIRALRRRRPQAHFVGAAGAKMAEAGCEVLVDMTRYASMLAKGVFQLWYFIPTILGLQRSIRRIRPDIHVPVDSPAINWHLASASKAIGTPVVYYIAPQVWAWAPWRVRKLARLTDHVACILPFEEQYLRDRGVKATYVGHPLFDTIPPRPDPLPDLTEAWLEGTWRVALLPGSRPGEIHDHTHALLDVSQAIRKRWPQAQCRFIAHTESDVGAIRRAIPNGRQGDVEIAAGKTRQVLAESHFAVAKSGTVTLELAHFGVPMVVFYRVHRLARAIHRFAGPWAVPTEMFSLVNIMAGRRIVPELIPWRGNLGRLREMVLEVMDDLGYLVEARQNLLEVINPLRVASPQTASDNAAEVICRVLERRHSGCP